LQCPIRGGRRRHEAADHVGDAPGEGERGAIVEIRRNHLDADRQPVGGAPDRRHGDREIDAADQGIPPEQVIGSSIKTKFELRDGAPVLVRLPEINFIDDKAGKPVGIQMHIGRRPIAAFGNSDGDLQMLQWTAAGKGARFCLYVHHTDAKREFAYDRKSSIGRLDKGLDEAQAKGWTLVDMKKDWKQVFPIQ